MVLEWFAEHRRHKILEKPFPEGWLEILNRNIPTYALLNEEEQARLRDDLRIFIEEKSWEGCGGLAMTDEIQVTIAAQACLLIFHRKHNYFANVESILVYPTEYQVRAQHRDPSGVVDQEISDRLGESWSNGPVVLSWFDVLKGGSNPDDGRNVVYHEFAHKLDATDDAMNGVPLLDEEAQVDEWAEVMQEEYQRLVAAVEKGHHTLIDPYGATNPAEFFAVVTECFFEKPIQMLHMHPRLYGVLQGYYHQDPATRLPSVLAATAG
ncbi:MAG TPA: M90 family metallopeptidase [Chthonomonadaceae bacterium]|nr:M90 family metallopeptidase [Chthonomonadaceae bacterium]